MINCQGVLTFDSIGVYPAQTFFRVDNAGRIIVTRSLKEDSVPRDTYTLRVITYDSSDPVLQDTSEVTIFVSRNPSVPQWSQAQYSRTVNEEYSLGIPVLNISATDADRVGSSFWKSIFSSLCMNLLPGGKLNKVVKQHLICFVKKVLLCTKTAGFNLWNSLQWFKKKSFLQTLFRHFQFKWNSKFWTPICSALKKLSVVAQSYY